MNVGIEDGTPCDKIKYGWFVVGWTTNGARSIPVSNKTGMKSLDQVRRWAKRKRLRNQTFHFKDPLASPCVKCGLPIVEGYAAAGVCHRCL